MSVHAHHGVEPLGVELVERRGAHAIKLKDAVATAVPWREAKVVPLYHPSGRAMANRPFEQQAKDYERLGVILRTDPAFRSLGPPTHQPLDL